MLYPHHVFHSENHSGMDDISQRGKITGGGMSINITSWNMGGGGGGK